MDTVRAGGGFPLPDEIVGDVLAFQRKEGHERVGEPLWNIKGMGKGQETWKGRKFRRGEAKLRESIGKGRGMVRAGGEEKGLRDGGRYPNRNDGHETQN